MGPRENVIEIETQDHNRDTVYIMNCTDRKQTPYCMLSDFYHTIEYIPRNMLVDHDVVFCRG